MTKLFSILVSSMFASACVGHNLAIFEPGTRESHDAIVIGGIAHDGCLGNAPVRGRLVRLVDQHDVTVAEDYTGVDGSFILRTRKLDEPLYLAAGKSRLRLPGPQTLAQLLYSSGSYKAEIVVDCEMQKAIGPQPSANPPAPIVPTHATSRSGARLPPKYLQPKGM